MNNEKLYSVALITELVSKNYYLNVNFYDTKERNDLLIILTEIENNSQTIKTKEFNCHDLFKQINLLNHKDEFLHNLGYIDKFNESIIIKNIKLNENIIKLLSSCTNFEIGFELFIQELSKIFPKYFGNKYLVSPNLFVNQGKLLKLRLVNVKNI